MVVPTITPAPSFNPKEDAEALRKALKGLGTDEKTIIKILTNRTSSQRQAILNEYNEDRDLIKDLKKDLSGNFEDLVLALMTPMDRYLATELHRAMEGVGTDEDVLIEILCTRDNHSLRNISKAYEDVYGKSLYLAVKKETSSDFEKLSWICAAAIGQRLQTTHMAPSCQKLYRAGEGRHGADEDEIRRILANCSFETLRLVFELYRKETGNTFGEVIEQELEGDFKKGMLAVYESIRDTPAYFAQAIHKAVAGTGTNDRTLIRLLVSRSEIDLHSIKKEYEVIYNKSLEKAIKGDTSGYYEKMLLALINE
ncbi:LOW QUALITY PROTEIN: annexin A3-like [Macrobrachium nipponense]|uniref:LOW QUALITY PROTEIN: annexin A3-like n=1 Tax=Macrobrachium nipponense TaxID=159736 RepID=UPI0030C898E6